MVSEASAAPSDVLDEESPEYANEEFRQAFRWGKISLLPLGAIGFLAAMQIWPLVFVAVILILCLGFFAAVVMVWRCVFVGSLHERGPWYALWHLVLTIMLTPWLLGLFVIPALVNQDALRLRRRERERSQ